jgi:hypothetical protein
VRLSLGEEDEYVGKWPATPEQCGDFIQDDLNEAARAADASREANVAVYGERLK